MPPSVQRYGKIFIGPIDGARGLSFDAVFVPGLAEKMFPRKIVEEPILLDAVRARIEDDLATNQTRLERERLALALAAGAAEHRIFFSYPRIDLDQTRPRVPSFYALEAVAIGRGPASGFCRDRPARRDRDDDPPWLAGAARPDERDRRRGTRSRHSLSTSWPFLMRARAAARYLLTVNPYLARALRSRYQRWSPTGRPPMVSSVDRTLFGRSWAGTRSLLAAIRRPRSRTLPRCPYRFFLQAVHGLAPREMPVMIDDARPPTARLAHPRCPVRIVRAPRNENLLPVRPSNLDRARLLLEEVVTEVAARYEDDLAPAIDRVWENGVAAIRADLREWLRRASEDDSGYVPWHFELSFGLAHRFERRQADPRSVADAVELDCGIQLRGSIDLVERHPSRLLAGHRSQERQVRWHAQAGHRWRQIASACPIRARGGKTVRRRRHGTEGRLYFCTSAGGFAEQTVPLNERARDAAMQVAEAVGDAITRPFLPAAPAEEQCERLRLPGRLRPV